MSILIKTKQIIKTILCKDEKHKNEQKIMEYYIDHGVINALRFNFYDYKTKVIDFLQKMHCEDFQYKYAASCSIPNLYSSVYACMILGLFNEIKILTMKQKKKWADYFDSFQNPEDGLFYDQSLRNEIYDNTDWWGARHLSSLILMAYNYLEAKPKYSFRFSKNDEEQLFSKIIMTDWNKPICFSSDIDNYLMNVLIMLVYERDFKGDTKAQIKITRILNYLNNVKNSEKGMWGKFNKNSLKDISRAIQFYYHLLPVLLYERKELENIDIIVDCALETQNKYGGFGISTNSSACEDIDSIYVLISLVNKVPLKKKKIDNAIWKVFPWVLSNQNPDGGFVFKRNYQFEYGHKEMSSLPNESEMHSTWFRTLSLSFITKYLHINNSFTINKELLNYSYIIQ